MCLAQGHNAERPVRLEPTALVSRQALYHWAPIGCLSKSNASITITSKYDMSSKGFVEWSLCRKHIFVEYVTWVKFYLVEPRSMASAGKTICPKVMNLFPCSTQLSTKFIRIINEPTIILIFISMINTISDRLKARNSFICRYFSVYEQLKFHAQLSWAWKKFYNLVACFPLCL